MGDSAKSVQPGNPEFGLIDSVDNDCRNGRSDRYPRQSRAQSHGLLRPLNGQFTQRPINNTVDPLLKNVVEVTLQEDVSS